MGDAANSVLDDCHHVAIRRRMAPIALRAWLERRIAGGKAFDFTIGDEPFKADFGCTRTPMHEFRP